MFFIYFKGNSHNGVFLYHRELQHWYKSLVIYWGQFGWIYLRYICRTIFIFHWGKIWQAPDDVPFHPAVTLMWCLIVLIVSASHSDEIAVIMWHGYSTSKASFGSCRSSPLLESVLAIVCAFPVRGWAGGSQVLGSCDSAWSPPSVVSQRA